MGSKFLCMSTGNIIKDPQWYGVQGSDTTMMTSAS